MAYPLPGPSHTRWPMAEEDVDELVLKFANLQSEQDLIEFANEYGWPSAGGRELRYVLSWAKWYAEIFTWAQQGGAAPAWSSIYAPDDDLEIVHAELKCVRGKRVILTLQAWDLITAFKIVLPDVLSRIQVIKTCKECGKKLMTGKGSSRRKHRMFCNDTCRYRFHNNSRRVDR